MQQGIGVRHCINRASPVSQMVKNMSAMQETWVQSLGQNSQVNKSTRMSSICTWTIPRTEKPGRLKSIGSQRVGHDRTTNTQYTVLIRAFTEGQHIILHKTRQIPKEKRNQYA